MQGAGYAPYYEDMSILTELPRRLLFLIFGFGLGLLLAFVLGFIWLVITGFVLGYGDSGPDWFNTVTYWIKIISIALSLVLSQLIFNYVKKRESK